MNENNSRADINSLRIDRSRKYNDRPRSRKWLWLVWLVVIAALAVAYLSFKDSVSPAAKVRAATATILTGSDSEATLVATGYVVAQRKAEVASKGTGRLEYLGFEEGDTVKTGQVIAELDNDDIEADLLRVAADLEYARADSVNAARQYRRATDLFASGSIRETDLESAETAFLLAQARVAGAIAAVRVVEVALENTFIRAPFDGTILTKNADIGEIVAPFASSASSKGSVVTLADMTSLEVEADVSESNIEKVTVGQRCEIILDAYPSTRYSAYAKKIVPTADRARATVQVKVAFRDRDERVLPEMSARVNFFPDEKPDTSVVTGPVIVIARDALTSRDGNKVVFVIENDTVTLRPVEPGRDMKDYVEIISGLKQGERVVLSPPGKMASGDKVEVTI